jgi:hypothetical protein
VVREAAPLQKTGILTTLPYKMKTSAAVATILGASISLGQPTHVKNMDPGNFTVALVRAPPANLPYPPPSEDWYGRQYDLDRTVEIGLGYIHEAALKGANLVAFPELWFPGYGNRKDCSPLIRG